MLERLVTNLTKKRVEAERLKPSYYFNTIYLYTSFQKMINVFEYVVIDMFYLITSAMATPMGVQNFFHLFLEKGLTDI